MTVDAPGTCHLVMCPDKGQHPPHPSPMAAPSNESWERQQREPMSEPQRFATLNAELWPLTEDNDGLCQCSRPATVVVPRCEWHPVVRRRRLEALVGAGVESSRWRSELVNERATLEAIEAGTGLGVLALEPAGVKEDGAKTPPEAVDHPSHYGGDTPYEAIKVIEAWGLGFHLGNAVKYLSRAGKKGDRLVDLRKARWYLDREIGRLEGGDC